MAVAFGVDAWQKKEMPRFLKATGVLLMAGILGVCINLSNLYHTYEYSKETMRGKSEFCLLYTSWQFPRVSVLALRNRLVLYSSRMP